jgi:hypothetical protein
MHMGPVHRVIFPYDFHFRTVNTHVFIPEPLTGDVPTDKKMIYEALAAGRCFVGYDLPASTRGFVFKARGLEQRSIMGDEIPLKGGVTLQAHLPKPADLRLIKDGKSIGIWKNSHACAYSATEPGVYRVEGGKAIWDSNAAGSSAIPFMYDKSANSPGFVNDLSPPKPAAGATCHPFPTNVSSSVE